MITIKAMILDNSFLHVTNYEKLAYRKCDFSTQQLWEHFQVIVTKYQAHNHEMSKNVNMFVNSFMVFITFSSFLLLTRRATVAAKVGIVPVPNGAGRCLVLFCCLHLELSLNITL